MKHILFVTSANLAINPRCVKEIKFALESGYKVSVVKFTFVNWSLELDTALTASFPSVTFYNLSADRKPFIPWFTSSVLEKLARFVSLFFSLEARWISYATGKRSWLIARFLDNLNITPDLIIGHNPAVFWPVAEFAKRNAIPFAIDVEDYHPGEYRNKHQYNNMAKLMKNTLKHSAYVSFASPLILQTANKEIQVSKNAILVNNCFEQKEFLLPASTNQPKLRLVWFSQNIDFERGLEKVLPVLKRMKQYIELTLIGHLREDFKAFLINYDFVTTVSPMPQKELHIFLNTFDIGLAIEERSADLNREICLTNKIWSYFQSGLFIVASDTKAQNQFISAHNRHGVLVDLSKAENMYETINDILNKKESIRRKMPERFNDAAFYSWENEKQKLKDVWHSVLAAINKSTAA